MRPLSPGLFFNLWLSAPDCTHLLRRRIDQAFFQLLLSTFDRLLIHPGDLRKVSDTTIALPVRFHRHKPAPQLLVQPARHQIDLLVDLLVRVLSCCLTVCTLTDVNF
jgi:hypothetical protein